ncbi:MAG: hypothetical protein RL701_2737 [Pseudomonadota bacterium]|jgi:hypothetical protein
MHSSADDPPPPSRVATQVATAQRTALAERSASERVGLALRLGRRDLLSFGKAQSLSIAEARQRLSHVRRLGRVRSACIEALDELGT